MCWGRNRQRCVGPGTAGMRELAKHGPGRAIPAVALHGLGWWPGAGAWLVRPWSEGVSGGGQAGDGSWKWVPPGPRKLDLVPKITGGFRKKEGVWTTGGQLGK